MSVLSFPRVYFAGVYSWDPGLANNFANHYDSVNVRIRLPNNVSYEQFPDYLIENRLGSWNYSGTHDCRFHPGRTKITAGALDLNSSITDDELIGKRIRLNGKLVDLDPESNWNSQIFFDQFQFGDRTVGIIAKAAHRLHSRWIGPRVTYPIPIAGAFGVVWQTVFHKDDVQFFGDEQSALVRSLKDAMAEQTSNGLMLRFTTYRTLYFQGDGDQDIEHPTNFAFMQQKIDELHERFANGENFSNPAFSLAFGTLGLWQNDEIASVPEGRFLATGAALPIPEIGRFPLGPCVVEVNPESKTLALDFCQVIPDKNFNREKVEIGNLSLIVSHDGAQTEIASIGIDLYGKENYELKSGIVDLDLSSHPDPLIFEKRASGALALIASSGGTAIRVIEEKELTVQAELRDIYLDEGQVMRLPLTVRHKGVAAPAGTKILAALYDRRRNLIPVRPGADMEILVVEQAGSAVVELVGTTPGFYNIQFYPFQGEVQPTPAASLDIRNGFFVSVRGLPSDNQLNEVTPNESLTWEFIYENILRPYDLLNPVMSRRGDPDIDRPLNDEAKMTAQGMIPKIRKSIAKSNFERTNYMPITRCLSAGKRLLLERWCDRIEDGAGPGPPSLAASLDNGPELRFDPNEMRKHHE